MIVYKYIQWFKCMFLMTSSNFYWCLVAVIYYCWWHSFPFFFYHFSYFVLFIYFFFSITKKYVHEFFHMKFVFTFHFVYLFVDGLETRKERSIKWWYVSVCLCVMSQIKPLKYRVIYIYWSSERKVFYDNVRYNFYLLGFSLSLISS